MAKKIFRIKTDDSVSMVDSETGEMLGFKKTKICTTQEEFIKVYLDQIGELTGCMEDGLYSVMIAAWKYSNFCDDDKQEGNIFHNDFFFKKLCRDLGLNKDDSAINTAVYRLNERGVIKRISKGTYILNPKYFVKGTLTNKTRMEIVIKFDSKHKK